MKLPGALSSGGKKSKSGKSEPKGAAPKREAAGAPKAREPQVRVAKPVYRKQIFRKLSQAFSYTVLVVFALYLCFAVTIVRVLPTNTSLGFYPVKNATYPGGMAPKGSLLVVDVLEPQGDSAFDRLKQSFLMKSTVALVEVEAGPFGRLAWAEGGLTTVDGNPVGVTLSENPGKEFLENEYLVKCVKGACAPGSGLLLPASHILGQPLEERK